MPTALLWFRRDLRLTDHPALLAAVDAAGQDGDVVGVFVVDPRLWEPAGEPRRAFLLDCLDELRTATGGALVLRRGNPVFNPVAQGRKFDPDGSYVRRWVPELRDLDARYVHEPWTAPGGVTAGYAGPIVDHAAERQVALDRYERVRAAGA